MSALQAAAARLRPAIAPPDLVRRALSQCLHEPRWSYHYLPTPRGRELVLRIAPSSTTRQRSNKAVKPYEARAAGCTCKGSFVRGCKHPTAALIVAEALEPTTGVSGTVPTTVPRAAFALALAADQPTVPLLADSDREQLHLGDPARASALLALDLAPDCRATLRLQRAVMHAELADLLRALDRDLPADHELLEIDVSTDSLSLYAWQDDEIVWSDGLLLPEHPP